MLTKLSALAFAIAAAVNAQSHPPIPKFDVVSIKPCVAGDRSVVRNTSPGRLSINCFPLIGLIRNAYIVLRDGRLTPPGYITPIENVPDWVNSAFYSIEATVAGDPGQMMMNGPMMRGILEDRFKLKIHDEVKDAPVYALTLIRGEPKLQETHDGSCFTADQGQMPPRPVPGQPLPAICKMGPVTVNGFDVRGVTMAEFGLRLSRPLDREVVDKTGLPGVYDFTSLQSATELRPLPPPPPPNGAAEPLAPRSLADTVDVFAGIQTALRKFGLKLESAKGSTRIFIIDHIEQPTSN